MDLKFILPAFFLLFSLKSISQSLTTGPIQVSLSGIILDSTTLQPIEYATISLFEVGNKKAIYGALTDTQGKFTLELAKTGVFNILVESIGYQSYSISKLPIDKSHTKILEKIYLTKKNTMLQSVTVVGSQKLIEK